MAGQVSVVALYDIVGYKPQTALDATYPGDRRATEFLEKGEVGEIPQSEYDRLTDEKKFPDGPAVRKADTAEVKAAAADETPPPATEQQSRAGLTPTSPALDSVPPDRLAAFNGLKTRELQKLARANDVTVSARARKPELALALAASTVPVPS